MDTTQKHLEELFRLANPQVQTYLASNDLDGAVAILGKLHKLPVGSYLPLKNTIMLILLGAIVPAKAVESIENNCRISTDDAYAIAQDLEETIFQKVRLSILGDTTTQVKQITLSDTVSEDDLRKEILDTTHREPTAPVAPTEKTEKEATSEDQKTAPATTTPKTVLAAGTRSQLLEQLQVLETIPNDEEIEARLNHIKEQINTIESTSKETTPTAVAVSLGLQEHAGETVAAQAKTASYSKAPTEYNIDPYREVAEI
jgi:hypothetical protein